MFRHRSDARDVPGPETLPKEPLPVSRLGLEWRQECQNVIAAALAAASGIALTRTFGRRILDCQPARFYDRSSPVRRKLSDRGVERRDGRAATTGRRGLAKQ